MTPATRGPNPPDCPAHTHRPKTPGTPLPPPPPQPARPTPTRLQVVDADHGQFESAFNTARDLADSPAEQALAASIWDGYQRYRQELDLAFRQAAAHSSETTVLTWAEAHPVRHLLEPCEELLRLNQQSMTDLARESQEVSAQGRALFLLLGILCPVGCLISAFVVAWAPTPPTTRP